MKGISQALAAFEAAKDKIAEAERRQLAVWEGDCRELPLLLTANISSKFSENLRRYNPKEIHRDSEKMFANGLLDALRALAGGGDAVPSIRANMGCSAFPSLFGVTPLLFEDKMPWVKKHLSRQQIANLKPGEIAPNNDIFLALEHMSFMRDQLQNSPVRIYPPDLQGPFDMAHIVYGDAIFYDLYDDPQFVHYLMELCCQAIIIGMEQCLQAIPDSERLIAHYSNLVIPKAMGGLKISEDTSTLLSRDCIDEFVIPYTSRVLEHFGGGYIHYCGKNDHLFESMLSLNKVIGINFGNPEMHDMDMILSKIAKAGKLYYGHVNSLPGENEREFFARVLKASGGRILLAYDAGDRDTEEIMNDWRESKYILANISDA